MQSNNEPKAQIDLLIERADNIINLCEIKYSETPYTLKNDEDMKIRTRIATFSSLTQTKAAIHPTFITTFGLAKNEYANDILFNLTLSDLFKI